MFNSHEPTCVAAQQQFSFSGWPLAVLAPKRDLGADFKNNIRKFLPLLRQPLYGLQRAADWLEALIDGTLPQKPLLDVSACFDDV